MLTNLELAVIKEYAKGEDIIYLNIQNREFVFRTLGVGEYLNIKKCVSTEKDFEDAVCQATLLYPEDQNIVFGLYPLAGVSSIACDEIIKHSGLDGMDNIRERIIQRKEEMNIFHNQCMNLVKAAFPELSYEEIEQYSWCKLVDIAVRAESVMAIRGSTYRLADMSEVNNEDIETTESQEEVEEIKEKTTRDYLEEGIEPMLYYSEELLSENGKEILDNPFIGGMRWNEEVVINEISKQF